MSAQLDLFAQPATTTPARPASAWREAILAAREQSPVNYPLGLVHRPYGGMWDRVTSPEARQAATHDDWPALWFIHCPIGRHAASTATLANRYTDRTH